MNEEPRVCTRCGDVKPFSEFGVVRDPRRNPPVKIRSRCKQCTREDKRARYHAIKESDPERHDHLWGKVGRWRREYGLTREQVDALVLASEGRCAICEEPTRDLVFDHDHVTGVVRGLLCNGCNTAIGKLGDTPDGVMRAVAYLLGAPQATLTTGAL
jgi:hypothetical protein